MVSKLRQPAWYWPLAFLAAGFYAAAGLYISSHRLLWYDEIFTALLSRLPDVRTTWKALSEAAEMIPALYFLITRAFDQLFRHADIGIRVPSVLALSAAMLVVFDLVRRLTDGLYGLIAVSFLTTSFVIYYGCEARPYALCFLLAAVALWLWVVTAEESRVAAAAFGAVFLAGVAVHYYFVLCLVPFGLMALAEKRFFHRKVVAAVAGVACAVSVLYPQIAKLRSLVHSGGDITFWTPPSLSGLQSVYLEFFPLAALPLVLIAAGVAAFGRPRKRLLTPMTSGERVSWLFLTVPLAAYCLALLVTGFFHRRYIIVAVPGIVVAAACFLWRHYKESGVLSLALLLIFGGIGVFDELRVVRNLEQIQIYGEEQRNTRQMLALEDTLRGEGKRNFGMASGILFLQAYYHSNHPEQYGLIRFKPPWRIAKYVPLRFLSMEQIVANARETALIDPPPPLALALEKAGLHLKVRSIQPYVVYLE